MLDWYEVLFLVIASVLFVNYIIFIVSLLVFYSVSPLNSGFFALTLTLGVVDIFQMLHVYLFLRFPSFGWFTDSIYLQLPPLIVKYGSCAMWELACTQYLAVTAIAINRCSAIAFPHGHKQRWRPRVAHSVVFFVLAGGVIFVSPKMVLKTVEKYHVIDNVTRIEPKVCSRSQFCRGGSYMGRGSSFLGSSAGEGLRQI
uniref:Uncharacterized protein n=1 Tax=Acrobeloides nanus TaxID=290746 RepID=A0A914D458_9BILA